jgi:hypothetical protein
MKIRMGAPRLRIYHRSLGDKSIREPDRRLVKTLKKLLTKESWSNAFLLFHQLKGLPQRHQHAHPVRRGLKLPVKFCRHLLNNGEDTALLALTPSVHPLHYLHNRLG